MRKKGGFISVEIKKVENGSLKKNYIALGIWTTFVLIYTITFLAQLSSGKEILIDKWIGGALTTISGEVPIFFFTVFTDIGSKWGIIAILLVSILFIWWKYRDYLGIGLLILSAAGGDQLNKWMKNMVARERPLMDASIYAEGFSFPSGHAMVGIMFFGFLAYILVMNLKQIHLKKLVAIGMSFLIFFIGISRIVLQAHYPTDVFGGFAIGLIFLVFLIFVYEKGSKKIRLFS